MIEPTPLFQADGTDTATRPVPETRTVKLKITQSGALVLAHPFSPIGPETNVSTLGLVHSLAAAAGWTYDWEALASQQRGAIVHQHTDEVSD